MLHVFVGHLAGDLEAEDPSRTLSESFDHCGAPPEWAVGRRAGFCGTWVLVFDFDLFAAFGLSGSDDLLLLQRGHEIVVVHFHAEGAAALGH